ncbi:TPA: hypothetical protein I4D55_001907 [Enterobacter hormaechei]|nr:hypothetical protein [Enterobacter hormaechei]
MQSDTVAGSTLNAVNNLSITATGKGQGENSGDILIGGSQLKTGGDTTLAAANDIALGGAASTQQTTGKNSSSGGGVGAVTGGMGKSGSSAGGKNIVVVDSGKKGAWNKAMNKPEPNTVYKVDGDKTFQTDSLGRISSAEGVLVASKSDRNTYQQCKAGKCGSSGDEGGHLIASIFNGPGEKINLVPMDGSLNKGVWKQMENTWANALKDGKQVNVKIEPVYIGDNKRPDSFSVTYSIGGGRPVIKDISNTPGGIK